MVNAAYMTDGVPETTGQDATSMHPDEEGRHVRDRREEQVVERLLLVVLEEQVVDVSLADLARVAGVDGSVLATLLPELLGGLVGEDDVALGIPSLTRSTCRQNGPVDHMLSTRGIPMRTFLRCSLDSGELRSKPTA